MLLIANYTYERNILISWHVIGNSLGANIGVFLANDWQQIRVARSREREEVPYDVTVIGLVSAADKTPHQRTTCRTLLKGKYRNIYMI